MRYSRTQYQQRQGSGAGKGVVVVVVLLAVAALVYFIGAAKIGNFISESIVTPVISWFTGEPAKSPEGNPGSVVVPTDTADPQNTEDTSNTQQLSLPAYTVYSLQVGVYQDRNNALSQAESLMNQGGAGYILDRNGEYRVLIAGYKTEDEAKNVKDRLSSEQDMDSKIYLLETKELALELSGSQEALEACKNALEKSSDYIDELLSLSLAFDKGEKTAEEISEELTKLKEQAEEIKNSVDELGKKDDNNVIDSLVAYYDGIQEVLDQLGSETEQLPLSSGLKHAYLELGDKRVALIEGLSSHTET